ncbi:MAG: alpha/beta fold hydrolase [Proteobacteria bacterium]|nr:alpha/beta fold hydrolase [Pseudomonadota bacterium]
MLLHGFGANLGTFKELLPFLLGKGSLVLVDLPGHGNSSVAGAPRSAPGVAEAVISALLDRQIDSFHLIGHSLGGLVASFMAAARPQHIERLSLIACAGVGPLLNTAFFRGFLAATSADELLPSLAAAYSSPPDNLRRVSELTFAWLSRPGVRAYLKDLVEAVPGVEIDLRSTIGRGVEITALWGRNDGVLPVENAHHLPAQIPVTVLPDAGHTPHIEMPAEVAKWLL